MTEERAIKHQQELAQRTNIGWWYGTGCEKCCSVYPKLIIGIGQDDSCRYECEVCGKKTKPYSMPWLAEEAWNNHEYDEKELKQFSLF